MKTLQFVRVFCPFSPWFSNCYALNSGHFTAIGCKGTAFFSYTKHFYAKSLICTWFLIFINQQKIF